ncbi:archaellin/type IV pilin N-terminal domain-containing protein [Salinibaculum rarum]|uniref:archaellin/type IV pilin N-terminal domain-containing protein n=1 Tax=Salinibaculum rarum TaxID=3058903 RepID=UPI002660156C|nr:archaellin/type IV pilin N-terminal domain-containing protein [Salinibaculum sp. KK48]
MTFLEHARTNRAQSGIGTLIILIAAILVATMAAGVFFDIAGLLQSESASTSEGVSQQLEGRLEIISVSGEVSSGTVDRVNVTVKLSSDSGVTDLRAATIQWIGPRGAETLTWSGQDSTGPSFNITTFGSPEPVLDAGTDRATFTIDLETFDSTLEPGDVVTLTIVTNTELVYRLQVPRSLSGRSTVGL